MFGAEIASRRAPRLEDRSRLTSNDRILCVVPARLGSQRLPGKPLRRLAGRPLIEWVWRRVSTFEFLQAVVIATDSDEVAEACARFGAQVEMTSAEHASGTDRVAEVVRRSSWSSYGTIVNVQGDEPLVAESHVRAAVEQVRAGWDIGTVAAPVGVASDWHDPSVVKVARRPDGAALYFSRAPIPFLRDGEPSESELASGAYLRHVGIYAYTRSALLRWVELPVGELETIERLEQLRPLAAGMSIGVAVAGAAESGVDTPADVERVERRLRELMTLEPRATVER